MAFFSDIDKFSFNLAALPVLSNRYKSTNPAHKWRGPLAFQRGSVFWPLCRDVGTTQCCMSFMAPPLPPFCASIFTLST